MIVGVGTESRYVTIFSDGRNEAKSDTTLDKGGSGAGFRPHDLLEAALACCLNISVRIYADKHNIPLSGIKVGVSLDRSDPEQTVFEYQVELQGDLTDEQRRELMEQTKSCPVGQTLSRNISFRCSTSGKGVAHAPLT